MAQGSSKPGALTDKQKAFVREYLKDFNGTRAVIRAGYSENGASVQATRLLADARIVEQLASHERKAESIAVVDRAWVLAKLRENVDRAMSAEPVLGSDGEETGEWRYAGNVANKALELLGKDMGMFVQQVEISGSEKVNAGLAKLHEVMAKKRG